ncbi:MAG: adenosine deaminase [Terriglobia bacterium]
MTEAIKEFIHRLPKAELHVHLEGSVQPQTLRELARRKGRLEEETEAWIHQQSERGYRYGSLPEFLNAFKLVSLLLDSPEDYALAASRLLENLAAQRVRYVEITLSAGVILWKNQSLPSVFEAIQRACEQTENRLPIRARWIFDAVRQFGPDRAREVLDWAGVFRNGGVIAFGIGGDEERGPAELFVDIFREARERGLHVVAHAGENARPESVRTAVERLGAERIGHGLSAALDPRVLSMLAARHIPLEVCPTSNVSTGLIASIEQHPLPRFLAAGVCVTLNSDDPALFGASLEDELNLLDTAFGLSAETVAGICANGILASFDEDQAKQALLAELRQAGTRSQDGCNAVPGSN